MVHHDLIHFFIYFLLLSYSLYFPCFNILLNIIQRTSNRAPGPNDNWWAKHHETCSGTFVKVSQPEPKTKAKKSKVEDNKLPKITNWLNSSQKSVTTNPPTARGGAGGSTKMNGGGTVVLKPTAKNRNSTQTSADNVGNILGAASSILGSVSDAVAGGNLRNVVGFRDLNDSGNLEILNATIVVLLFLT